MTTHQKKLFPNHSTIYGPVKSWRFGQSLGVDPIFVESTCSFNCIYCQLGNIQNITNERKIYVETKTIVSDMNDYLKNNIAQNFDVITYSGSGEPTLALNLSDIIIELKILCPDKPQYILTNATELSNQAVRENLNKLDKVIVKIDAWDELTFQKINRPVKNLTLQKIIDGIKSFSQEFRGDWEIQTMLMPLNSNEIENFITILKELRPTALQLNTPKRPYPLSWHRENRGNHLGIFDHEVRQLKSINPMTAGDIETILKQNINIPIYTVYR